MSAEIAINILSFINCRNPHQFDRYSIIYLQICLFDCTKASMKRYASAIVLDTNIFTTSLFTRITKRENCNRE